MEKQLAIRFFNDNVSILYKEDMNCRKSIPTIIEEKLMDKTKELAKLFKMCKRIYIFHN